ncbi:MAG: hypothetical protein ABII00_08735 [Elusimicrobiota bacterium]
MKCPACGFETPDAQGWCDFCKEPFRKKAAERAGDRTPAIREAPDVRDAEAVIAVPDPVELKKTVPVPQHVLEMLKRQRAEATIPEKVEIPPEFADLDPGGRVPQAPPLARKLAWVFLGICVLWIFVATIWMVRNKERIAARAVSGSLQGIKR